MQIRKILYPTDFSEDSHAALSLAESLAKSNEAKLIILHVHEPARAYGAGLAAAYATLPDEVKENLFRRPVMDDVATQMLLPKGSN